MDNLFSNTGFMSGGLLNLTPRQAHALCMKGAIVVDVREPFMNRYKMLDVPEIIYCPYSMLAESWSQLPLDKPMILADAAGIHSREAVQFLAEKGATLFLANLAGGLVEWERDGLPLITDMDEQLSGSCMCQLRPRNKKR
jgi:rhodanese-related sulfurtransferase